MSGPSADDDNKTTTILTLIVVLQDHVDNEDRSVSEEWPKTGCWITKRLQGAEVLNFKRVYFSSGTITAVHKILNLLNRSYVLVHVQ